MKKSLNNYSSLILIIFIFNCCTKKNDVDILYSEYVKFDSALDVKKNKKTNSIAVSNHYYVFLFEFYYSDKLQSIKGSLDYRPYGHNFVFNRAGLLVNYKFLIGGNSSYEIQKDGLSSKYFEIGTPFVDYMMNPRDSFTSIEKYSLLFTQFPRKKMKMSISMNGIDYKKIKFVESNIMPLLVEFDLSKNLNVRKIFLKTEVEQLLFKLPGIDDRKIFYDTLVCK